MRFHPIPPYDFARTIEASRHLFVMGRVYDDAYRRIVRVGDALALIEMTGQGTRRRAGA